MENFPLMSKKKSGIELLKNNQFRAIDYWMIVPVLVLTVIGLFVLQNVLAAKVDNNMQTLIRQLVAAILGALVAVIICFLESQFLKLIGWTSYVLSMLLLFYVLVDGKQYVSGADAWIMLPFLNMTFQPSELTKIALVLLNAYILEKIADKELSMLKGFLYITALFIPPIGLIMMQPDVGTAMVIVFSICCMLYIWGVKYRYIFLALSGLVVAAPFIFLNLLEPFQQKRILSLFFTGTDESAEYNLNMAKKAISSGGLAGSSSGIPVDVPVKESDFIFSAISEYMGFIGTTAVILLAFFFLGRCVYVASKMKVKSDSFIIIGLTGNFAFHFIENMGMCVGLLPITGIPLPFISSGGTALMVNFISIGIILNLSMRRNLSR